MLQKEMSDALRDFLEEFEYDLWATFTLKHEGSLEFTSKRIKHFLKHLNRPDEPYYEKYIDCWIFYEKQSSGVHAHALIRGISPSLAGLVQKRAERELGVAEVEPYIPHGGAARYLSVKYNRSCLLDFQRCRINSRVRKFDNDFAVAVLWFFFVATHYASFQPTAIKKIIYFFKENWPKRKDKLVSACTIEHYLIGWGFKYGEQEAVVEMDETTGGVALQRKIDRDKAFVKDLLHLPEDSIIKYSFVKVKNKFKVVVRYEPSNPAPDDAEKPSRHQYHEMEYKLNHAVELKDGKLYTKSPTIVFDEELFGRLLVKYGISSLPDRKLRIDLMQQPFLPEWAKDNPYFRGIHKRRNDLGLYTEGAML